MDSCSGTLSGAVRTQPCLSALPLSAGATWLHGIGTPELPNPLFAAAVEQGLLATDPPAERYWRSQFLLPGATQPLGQEEQAAVVHTLAAWTDTIEGLPQDAAGTTADHLAAAWEQLQASGRLGGEPERQEAARRAWRWRERLQRAMDGCHSTADQRCVGRGGLRVCVLTAGRARRPSALLGAPPDTPHPVPPLLPALDNSARGLALYDEMGELHCAVPAGMQTVADGLASQVADLRFGHTVRSIEWARSSAGARPVRITCSNGAAVEADAAIVTVSLGVLQAQHAALFSPPLPAPKAAAIAALRCGVVDKLMLDFGTAGAGDAAAAAPAAAPAAAGSASGGSAAPPVSYALLWSRAWEGASGTGSAATAPVGAPTAAEAAVPEWARDIFAVRFGGPEVKHAQHAPRPAAEQPAAAAAADAAAAGHCCRGAGEEEECSPCAASEARGPTCYQAVAWLTGEAALAMEAATDAEVLAALRAVAAAFPQLQLPPGASWDTVRLYR